jgi:hypothetical protein
MTYERAHDFCSLDVRAQVLVCDAGWIVFIHAVHMPVPHRNWQHRLHVLAALRARIANLSAAVFTDVLACLTVPLYARLTGQTYASHTPQLG